MYVEYYNPELYLFSAAWLNKNKTKKGENADKYSPDNSKVYASIMWTFFVRDSYGAELPALKPLRKLIQSLGSCVSLSVGHRNLV